MKILLDNSTEYIKSLFNNPLVKIVGAEATILMQSYSDAKLALTSIVVLVITDTVLGLVIAAEYGNLSSWRFRKSLYKLCFYLVITLLASWSFICWGTPWIKDAVIGLIISTEIISIIENTEIAFPGVIPRSIIKRLKLSIHRKKLKHK